MTPYRRFVVATGLTHLADVMAVVAGGLGLLVMMITAWPSLSSGFSADPDKKI